MTILALDRRNASLTPDATDSGKVRYWFLRNCSVLFAPLRDASDMPTVNVRVFVDVSVLEIFVNQRVALTGLVFPVREDSVHVRADDVVALDIWLLSPTRPVVVSDVRGGRMSAKHDDVMLLPPGACGAHRQYGSTITCVNCTKVTLLHSNATWVNS
jgi:hypothetical protein